MDLGHTIRVTGGPDRARIDGLGSKFGQIRELKWSNSRIINEFDFQPITKRYMDFTGAPHHTGTNPMLRIFKMPAEGLETETL